MDHRIEAALKEIVKKITPAVVEMYERNESGSIILEFAPGEFKRAKHHRIL